MRDFLFAVLNLAGAVIVTAIAILYGTELGLWRIAFWIAAAVFVASALGLSVYSFIRRDKEVMASTPANRALTYLTYRDAELGPAIISMARQSAWGRWFAAQHLVNSGARIDLRHLYQIAAGQVMDEITNGNLDARGRRPDPKRLEYELIDRTYWRSSWLCCVEDPMALWKIILVPRGAVQIDRDGTVHAQDATAAQRTALLDYDSLIVDGYQFESLWPIKDAVGDERRRDFLRQAHKRGLDKDEMRRLS